MGPNLADSPDTTARMIRAWLGFYRRYQSDLVDGRFSIFGQLQVPNHKIEGQNRTFAYIRNLDFQELAASGKTIVLVNATDGPNLSGIILVVPPTLEAMLLQFLIGSSKPNRTG